MSSGANSSSSGGTSGSNSAKAFPHCQAILFDLDDTLVPGEAAYDFALREMQIQPNDPLFLQGRELTKKQLPAGAPIARSRVHYFKKYLELKNEYTPQKHYSLADKYEELVVHYMKDTWTKLKRNELMAKIHLMGFKIAIVTNESLRFQSRKLGAFWPANIPISALVTSEEVGFEKPHPKIFEVTFSRLRIRPDQALFIGDSLDKDISPSVKMGMPCVLTTEFLVPKEGSLGTEESAVLDQGQEVISAPSLLSKIHQIKRLDDILGKLSKP